jgi:5,10-methylene-tetrahydrofolate dehydrogenase/methenyl tetrahydrofolate cyclohydrolase
MWTFVNKGPLWDKIQATTGLRKDCLEEMQISGEQWVCRESSQMASPSKGTVLCGKKLASAWRSEVAREVQAFRENCGHTPTLAVVQVGSRPDSEVYVRRKREACESAGMLCHLHTIPSFVSEADVERAVSSLCADGSTDGVLVQLPLPPHVRQGAVAEAIDPRKDVDGLHPFSIGSLALRNVDPTFEPATAKGVMELMRRHRVSTHNARCVILGNSNSVGLPLGFLLRDAGAKSVATLPRDDAIGDEGKRLGKAADLIFAAVGSPHCISTEHASAGASIVDVGINAHPVSNDPAMHQRNEEQKMQRQRAESQQWSECSNETARYQWPLSSDGSFRVAGDVCMEPLINHGCNVTPVPGGAGPMTVAALLQNLLTSAETRYRSEMHQQSSSALLS